MQRKGILLDSSIIIDYFRKANKEKTRFISSNRIGLLVTS